MRLAPKRFASMENFGNVVRLALCKDPRVADSELFNNLLRGVEFCHVLTCGLDNSRSSWLALVRTRFNHHFNINPSDNSKPGR